ncbi:MAG: HAMP domain-containing sensor histidine kinase [Sphingobium sp.]|uniref:HAMP domain-containing sensor histidine kinase n=1 Tax=Sphingobium sp. CECT 9361 TaxID=2845384 RepID=UPI001E3C99B9|nr:HAMP domain-containing sensor histidine kinase [Sphingobium sp. CECT 9361]CAH0350623.1 Signal transduction histidine-protein kinase BaeS [Sphingobium sp. CECT 9361]
MAKPSVSLRLHHARPIRVNGQVVGAVLVSRSPRALFKGMYEDRGKIALGVIVIFGTLVLISAILARAIVRPIENLSRATHTMATGRAITLQRPSLQVVEVRVLYDDFEKMAEAIAQRSRYLRDFAAALSHEFKTPLASISGAIELLEDHADTMSDADRQKFLGNMAVDADRLSRLVRRMMELAKADMQLPNGTERIDVMPVLAKIADSYRSPSFVVQVQAASPRSGALIDHISLERIAATLVENSKQAGATKVLIYIRYMDGQMTIAFEDDGDGISEADRARIFEPFFTSKRHKGGTGMGLSIARSLAEAHGGTLGLAHSNQGARFKLALTSG